MAKQNILKSYLLKSLIQQKLFLLPEPDQVLFGQNCRTGAKIVIKPYKTRYILLLSGLAFAGPIGNGRTVSSCLK